MEECRWLKPVLVGQFEFTEWTPDNHLRHSLLVALREDNRGHRGARKQHLTKRHRQQGKSDEGNQQTASQA
jgi:bifunctional non-homologous end joining protein LigD